MDQNTPNSAPESAPESIPAVAPKKSSKLFLKIGVAMLLVSGVMTAGFYSLIQAQTKPYIAAEHVRGTQSRNVNAQVLKVQVSGPIDVNITQNNVPSLQIDGEQKSLDKIETVIDGDTLRISGSSIGNHHRPTRIQLNLPNLVELKMQGSGDTNANGFNGEKLIVSLQGSGDLRFNGQYKNVAAKLQGSGDLHLQSGTSDSVELEVTGSGDLTAIGISKSLKTKLNGSGDLHAEKLQANSVQTETIGAGETTVYAKQDIRVDITGTGEVNVRGNPVQRNILAKGKGEVNFE